MHTFLRTDSTNADFIKLVALLDADLKIRDGEDHDFYHQFNKIDMIRNAVVCYADGLPVACGAFKPYADRVVEVKRMFVLPQRRGHGLGHLVLNELERWAGELNYTQCILETGKMQPEAIALYTKAGYHITPNYGQYEGVENSVCMAKKIEAV
ncbi:MAG: GNAT family N-acetyltransferase [Chitinophagales bacterium]|nr:GNAT family N-acetyltransferase [Chitinophagales bacterium]